MSLTTQPPPSLPASDRDPVSFESLVQNFEHLWMQGQRPVIQDFLLLDGQQRQQLLIELVHAELELRLKAGEAARVEDYLRRFPELAEQPTVEWELIVQEYSLRSRREPGLSLAEYVNRFPHRQAELRQWQPPPQSAETPVVRAVPASPQELWATELPARNAADQANGSVAAAGFQVPGYEILGELGRGGMGVVYLARQVSLQRLVALKMILAGVHAGGAAVARFRTEAEALARLQHPNIVQVYEVGEYDGKPYFSLEFCPGGSLDKKLNGTPLPGAAAARLVETLARAVHAAHEKNVLHRDLKPANVLLTEDGTPKITDFGLAKKTDEAGQTQSDAILGTPPYMAPEQASGKNRLLGPATDVYALGAILYELLTGRPPFKGTDTLETLLQVCTREPVPPSRLQPGVPRDLETICLKCLAKEQPKRYATAGALAEDLRRFLNGEPIQARPTPTWERLWKFTRRKPVVAALLLVSALALVTGMAAIVFYARSQTAYAHAREQEADNYKKQRDRVAFLAQRSEGIRQLLALAQKLKAAGDWTRANTELKKAQAALDELPDLRADDLRAEVREALEEQDQWQAVRQRLQAFQASRDRALFCEMLFTGLDRADNQRKAQEAARTALTVYGLDAAADPVGGVAALLERDRLYHSPQEHALLAEDCYQMLVIWAETEALPVPGQAQTVRQGRQRAEKALALLARVERLGRVYSLDTQTFYRRKARYRAQSKGEPFNPARIDPAMPGKPTGALDWFLEGMEHYRAERYEKVSEACREVLGQRSKHFWARYLQALCHLRQGDWVEAKVELALCVEHREDFAWPRLLRGFAASQLGRKYEKDPKEKDKAVVEYRAAEEDFDLALKLDRDPQVQYVGLANRGVLHIYRQRLAEAVQDLRQALVVRPDGFQASINLAQALQGQGKWAEAEAELDRAIQRAPNLALLYESLGQLHLLRDHWTAAKTNFALAITREPENSKSEHLVSSLVELGRLLNKERKYEAALENFDRALRLRPDYVLAERFRAETLLALHRRDEAGKALDAYLAATPKAPAEVYQARGLIYAEIGRLPAAIDMYSAALQQNPEDTATRRYRGWAYLLSDSVRLALADFEVCVEKESANADALVGRGTARIRLKQLDEALEDAAEAQKQDRLKKQLTHRLLYNLACLYARATAQLDAEARTARPPRDQQAARQATRLEEKALQCLNRALEEVKEERRTAYWHDEVEGNPVLAPIRRGKLYLDLSERYGKAPSTPRRLP